MLDSKTVKILLFDLGGVLFKLRDPIETFSFNMNRSEFGQRWILSTTVRKFESGELQAREFAENITAEFNLPYDWQEFLQRFDYWPECFYPGALHLLDSIPQGIELALLSNTNARHWNREDIAGALEGRLDSIFLSYKTGALKPDAAAFEGVIAAYRCDPDEILFFDDNPLNVAAAQSAGLQSARTNGSGEAENVLRRLNILQD